MFCEKKEDINAFGIEWRLLELTSVGAIKDNKKEQFVSLIKSKRIDWGKLIEKAANQKLLGLLYWTLIINNVETYIPKRIINLLKIYYDYNTLKQKIYCDEALEFSRKLEALNIPYVMTKGLILSTELYENSSSRDMNDIDFIIEPTHKNEVQRLLKELNYFPGYLDIKGNKRICFTREEEILCNITNNKMLGHVKEIDNPIVHGVYIGVDFSLTWSNFSVQIPVKQVLEKRIKYQIRENESIYSFSPEVHFLYLVMHLLKHAWSESLQLSNDSCNLMQFADVYRFWNKYKKEYGEKIIDTISKYNVQSYVGWVIGQVDYIFSSNLASELRLKEYTEYQCINERIITRGKVINVEKSVLEIMAT